MAELNLRTPTSYNGQPATIYKMGAVRLATLDETVDGLSDRLAVTPKYAAASLVVTLASPPPIGSVTPNTGKFTTLTATGATNLVDLTATGTTNLVGLTATGATTLASTAGVAAKLGNATGTLGFFGSTGTTKQTQGAITNSVTAGGTTGTIANFTDLTVYANDSAAIRNDIYQLSLALANIISALRGYGLFT